MPGSAAAAALALSGTSAFMRQSALAQGPWPPSWRRTLTLGRTQSRQSALANLQPFGRSRKNCCACVCSLLFLFCFNFTTFFAVLQGRTWGTRELFWGIWVRPMGAPKFPKKIPDAPGAPLQNRDKRCEVEIKKEHFTCLCN